MRNLGLIITFWLASIALPSNVIALGMGEIEVNSFLNQPLKAEIEVISARTGEIDNLLVSLASRDAFTRAGLSRPSHLAQLRFSVQKNEEGDQAVILVTTRSAIREPFLNFLVEADWSKGRLLKEYTVLLDPPFYADSAAPAELSPPVQIEPVALTSQATDSDEYSSVISGELQAAAGLIALTESIDTTDPIATFEPVAITEPIAIAESIEIIEPIAIFDTDEPDESLVHITELSQVSDGEFLAGDTGFSFDGEVQIFKGNTLWSIASRYKDSEHSMSQVMLAMQRTNPEAFGDGNINHLKIGAVLRAPDADELELLSIQEAHAQVLEQNGLWDDYVARVTGTTSAAMADVDSGTDAGDTSMEETGNLSLLAPGDGDSDAAGLQSDGEDANELMKQLAFAEEELEASRVENQELESKIADLEARLNKFEELQKMIEIEDDSLAQLQANQAEEQVIADQAAAQDSSDDDLLDDLLAEEASAEMQASDVIVESDIIEEPIEESDVAPPAPVIVTDSAQKTGTFLDDILPAEILDLIPMDLFEILPSMDSLLQDPIMLGALGGILVLLLILMLYKRRKRGSEESEEEEGITVSDPNELDFEDEFTPIGIVEESGEEDETNINVPDEEDLIEHTQSALQEEDDFMATAVIPQADVGEIPASDAADPGQDDVLDEVDVYLAYGLYDNAEELLNQKLEADPERADYRSKLLDTYFATKNSGEFVKQAEKLKSMGEIADRYWDRIQVMGYELAPDNALFSGGKDSTMTPADLGLAKPETADFDLGAEEDDTNFSITDFNLGEESDDFSETQKVEGSGADNEFDATAELADFSDLDDDDATVSETAGAPESDETDIGDLDFAFDFDDDDEEADEVQAGSEGMDFELPDDMELSDIDGPTEVDEPLEATAVVDISDDFSDLTDLGDLEDLGEDDPGGTGEIESTAVLDSLDFPGEASDDIADDESEVNIEATAIVGTVDFPSVEEEDIDLGLDDTSEQPAVDASDDDLEMVLGDDDFDTGDDDMAMDFDDSLAMDVDLDTDDENRKTNTFAPGDFDDLEELSAEESIIEGVDLDDISGLMLPDDVDEVSTKLDLARAFIDMGDAEGARGSLNEVLAEGNDEQKSEAQTLLGQI